MLKPINLNNLKVAKFLGKKSPPCYSCSKLYSTLNYKARNRSTRQADGNTVGR